MSKAPSDLRILVVDDDGDLCADVAAFLTEEGCVVEVAADVAGARARLADRPPQICLVDIVMPGTSGKVLCREILERHGLPVVMMSSLSDEDTVVALLELGADDFLGKPFRMREMLARLRAV
ncbi:MAG: response regulator transcription factor, partial [Pseudomonadota bacterium]